MKTKKTSRRDFLKQLAFAGASVVAAPTILGALSDSSAEHRGEGAVRPRVPGAKSVENLVTSPREKVRVAIVGLGQRGLGSLSCGSNRRDYAGLLGEILNVPFAQVTGLCDIDSSRAEHACEICLKKRPGDPRPSVYAGTENAWEHLCENGNADVVVIATPWHLHVPVAIAAMNAGKHAFLEVPAALTVDDCWTLVDASEQTQRHCVLLENCCFGDEEMFVLNMVKHGVFGKITHAECAYLHDLRAMLFRQGTEGDWRRKYHQRYNGNLYPTHGLGPVCKYLDINRADRLKSLVSMSSSEAGLSEFRERGNTGTENSGFEKYVCGDMNITLIKTKLGRTILLKHDVVTPQPYSRINRLSGTEATFSGYPPRLTLEFPEKYDISASSDGHVWLGERDFSKMLNMFREPFWRERRERIRNFAHGGMDYAMCFRLLDSVRQGTTPEITVYDAAAWSCIVELSAESVAKGSVPVKIPDFTRADLS